jgi:hypothetical protein
VKVLKVWRLAETYYDSELVPPNFHSQSVELLRRWFAYVLVECPDVREMAAPWQITSLVTASCWLWGRASRNVAKSRKLGNYSMLLL